MNSIRSHGRTIIAIPLLATLSLAGSTLILPSGVLASDVGDASSPHKVFVCKYVGTPGVDERLKLGQNPISVDLHTIDEYRTFDGDIDTLVGRPLRRRARPQLRHRRRPGPARASGDRLPQPPPAPGRGVADAEGRHAGRRSWTASARSPRARSSGAGSTTSPARPPTRWPRGSRRRTPRRGRGSGRTADLFDATLYGDRPATRDDAGAVLGLDDTLAGTR